jgi:hypothetical protein
MSTKHSTATARAPGALRKRAGQSTTDRFVVRYKSKPSEPWRAFIRHALSVAADHLAALPRGRQGPILQALGASTDSAAVLRVLLDPPATERLPAANQAALERAFARAQSAKAELLSRADMLTGEQLAKRLHLTRATVDNRRRTGKLLALELGAKRGLRYPDWQRELLQDTASRAAYERTLQALGGAGSWSRYRFFTQAQPALGGQTPIHALQTRNSEAVLRAAATWASGEQGGA